MSRGARIQTRRLRLRSWRKADVERFHSGCNTAEVMRWLGGVQKKKQLRQDVAYFDEMEKREGFTFWVVERRRDKAFLGFVGLIRVEEEDCPFVGAVEIGWRLRRSVWRRGYGFEAASAVLDYAFTELRLSEVVSRTAKENVASIALMRKLGMKRRSAMDYRPAVANYKLTVFKISAKQWLRRREAG